MKLPIKEILTLAGSTALNVLLPGSGSLVVNTINRFLDDDKKLPANATGTDAQSAVSTLSADHQAQIMSKELDVELAEIRSFTDVQKSMHEVDKTGNTTRPEIARDMANIIGFATIYPIAALVYGMLTGKVGIIKSVNDTYLLIGTIIGVPATVLLSYFGKRTKEKQQKYEATTGTAPPQGVLGQLLGTLIKK